MASRREFIKFVVAGSVAPGCSIDKTLLATPDSKQSLTSEAVCLSKAGSEWAELVLAGKPGAKELAEKALATIPE
jgi:hypothetical protein